MTDFFSLIYDAALNSKNKILTDDEEYQELMKEMSELSEKYKKLDLTEEQRQVIDNLIQTSDTLNEKEMFAIYKKGILNCAEVMKDLGFLK